MEIPKKELLGIDNLCSVFNHTTNSYKFYWFLAILKNIKKGKKNILIDELIIDMIAEVWYPINYFKLSFGLQDQFNTTIEKIQIKLNLPKEVKKEELIFELKKQKNIIEIKNLIKTLSRWVPKRFLRPWFLLELRGVKDTIVNNKIIELSKKSFINLENPSLYKFNEDKIEININWFLYLQEHLGILNGFTYWNLNLFLQKRNPNVSNIPIKLFPPEKRDLSSARAFWDIYLKIDKMNCIYSNSNISTEYSIDHFLPWSFTGHDQLWNLIPTLKSINSSKSDCLPNITYLNSFASLQFNAFHKVLSEKGNKIKLFEDYIMLFNLSISEIEKMEKQVFINKLIDNLKPQLQIAKNMGFQSGWKYSLKEI